MTAAYLAAWAWNAHWDRLADELNATKADDRASTPMDLLALGRASAIVAAMLALITSYQVLLLVGACLVLAWAYSAPPLRWKRWPGLATATLGLLSVLSL